MLTSPTYLPVPGHAEIPNGVLRRSRGSGHWHQPWLPWLQNHDMLHTSCKLRNKYWTNVWYCHMTSHDMTCNSRERGKKRNWHPIGIGIRCAQHLATLPSPGCAYRALGLKHDVNIKYITNGFPMFSPIRLKLKSIPRWVISVSHLLDFWLPYHALKRPILVSNYKGSLGKTNWYVWSDSKGCH